MRTTQEAGLLSASDDRQLAYAVAEGRVLVTQDDDFLRLAATGVHHGGIVYAPQGTAIGTFIRGLMEICAILDDQDMVNHIEFLAS